MVVLRPSCKFTMHFITCHHLVDVIAVRTWSVRNTQCTSYSLLTIRKVTYRRLVISGDLWDFDSLHWIRLSSYICSKQMHQQVVCGAWHACLAPTRFRGHGTIILKGGGNAQFHQANSLQLATYIAHAQHPAISSSSTAYTVLSKLLQPGVFTFIMNS